MLPILSYSPIFEAYLMQHKLSKDPLNLYAPVDYILALGGKRLRPIFVLAACDMFHGDGDVANKVAMSVEIFHNFTLLHDDIMDAADIRRGQATVHNKYGVNTAILSGDVMLIHAYQCILDIGDPVLIKKLLDVFNKMAIEVCEGQQMDVDFESRDDVTIPEYIHMVTYKTSVLIAAASQMGAILAGADDENQRHIYEFAKNFGIAFQLQDDVLDTFGEEHQVGKRIGGDIIQNKKTYLYLKSLELASQRDKEELQSYYNRSKSYRDDDKIKGVKAIYERTVVKEYAAQVIEAYRDLSLSHLDACQIDKLAKENLINFVNQFIFRQF